MVTETMTEKEIIREVVDDIDVLSRRVVNKFNQDYRKEVLRRGKYPFVFTHKTVTANRNKYIVIGCVTSKKMAQRGVVMSMTFLVVDTDRGKLLIRVGGMTVDNISLTFFEPHFWSRYRERMELGDNLTLVELVERFFKRNCDQGFPIKKVRNDAIEYEAAINDGSVMMQVVDGKLTAKTFICKKTFGRMKKERHKESAVDMVQMDSLDSVSRSLYDSEKQKWLRGA